MGGELYDQIKSDKMRDQVFHLPTTKKKRFKLKKKNAESPESSIMKEQPEIIEESKIKELEQVSTKIIGKSKYQIRRPLSAANQKFFFDFNSSHLGWGNSKSSSDLILQFSAKKASIQEKSPLIKPQRVFEFKTNEQDSHQLEVLRNRFNKYVNFKFLKQDIGYLDLADSLSIGRIKFK